MASARLHLRQALGARMQLAFERQGLDFSRHVQLPDKVPESQFLQLAAGMDVNLDSIGWSGGVSTFDLLAQDLPTVTMETPTLRGRQSAAQLRRIDCAELIAADDDAYVRLAVELGHDRDRRMAWRERIAANRHRLYDDPAPVAAFAAFLHDAVPKQ